MTLIGEADLMCNFANRVLARGEELSCFSCPRFNDILVRRLTSRLFEQKREVVGAHAYLACNRGDCQGRLKLIVNICNSALQLLSGEATMRVWQNQGRAGIFAQQVNG